MQNDGVMHSLGDTISISVLFGYFLAGLPTLTLLVTFIWTVIRIWETKTVQSWIGKKHD